ncbi:MAG: hypothetical protein ACRC2S_00480 [Waterburya sp.]
MNNQPIMPDSSVDTRLINNLRRARLNFEEVGLQLEEIIAKFDAASRQQRLERISSKQQS